MMVRHPVPDELLLDYAVGSAGPGKAMLVATHLTMCPDSRRRYAMLQQIGCALLGSLHGAGVDRIGAAGMLAHADVHGNRTEDPRAEVRHDALPAPGAGGKLREIRLPAPLASCAQEIEDPRAWRPLGLGVEAAILPSVSTLRGKTQLLRARPGRRILPHAHLGEEVVLVLQGAYWDRGERFGPGDVAVNEAATAHAPVIEDGEDCYCLAVSEGPIRFVGPCSWLLNMLIRF